MPVSKITKIIVEDEDGERIEEIGRKSTKTTPVKPDAKSEKPKKAVLKKKVATKTVKKTAPKKKKITVEAIKKQEVKKEEKAKEETTADTVKKEIESVNEPETKVEDKSSSTEATEDKPEEKQTEEDVLSSEHSTVKDLVATSVKEEEYKEVEEIVNNKIKSERHIKLYRKIAYFFIILTVILVAVVSYYSFARAIITLIPNQERISNNMIFDVTDKDLEESNKNSAVIGVVKQVEIESEIVFEPTGIEVIGEEAVGKATIYNNYTKNQPLVATTRILTPDSKLFRIKNTVNVPAGSSIEVEIYADEPSAEMAIDPTRFTLPGLWAGLQDKIYAESKEKVVYQQKIKKHILEKDIDDSTRKLKQNLLTEAKSEINESYKEYGQIIYKIDENSIYSNVEGEVDEEVDEFKATMKADVIVVAFEDDKSVELAKQKFVSSMQSNKELLSFDEDNIIYSLNNYNHKEGIATINATFEGKVSLKEDSNTIELDKILGLNNEQLEAYLNTLPEIAGFEIKYFPSFIKKVPKLVDRISIEIKK